MSVIPCITWVRKGKSKQKPEKLQIAEEDLKRIIEETQERLEEEEQASSEDEQDESTGEATATFRQAETMENPALSSEVSTALDMVGQLKKGQKKKKKEKSADEERNPTDEFESRYNFDNYDDEEEDTANPLKGIGNLTVYSTNKDDPYITLKNEDSDEEDFEIKDSDNLLLVARAESDFCTMEVNVYNAELGNLYCHHDILLGSFPLAVEWMDYDLRDGTAGNFVSIATMDPTIDIWDLDLIDSLEPLATLGHRPKKKKKKVDIPSHTDAVLDLSWNQLARHVLASASADFTVGLWDLTEGKLASQLRQHKEKVQCVEWHPAEEHMLLSGSFDQTVRMYDCRSPDTSNKIWSMQGEIEKLLWNTYSPMNFFASTDKGTVFYMDTRHDKPVYTLSAHPESVTGLNLSSEDRRLLMTTSSDQTVKIWDIENDKPSLIHSQNLRMGQILCLSSCPDLGYVFAMGGEKKYKVWDIREVKDVFKHFCGSEGEHVPDLRPEQEDDQEAAMEMEEMNVAMETEPTNETSASSEGAVPKKKKKKKRKPRKP